MNHLNFRKLGSPFYVSIIALSVLSGSTAFARGHDDYSPYVNTGSLSDDLKNEFFAVTRKYGRPTITEMDSDLDLTTINDARVKIPEPWSGYWLPFAKPYLWQARQVSSNGEIRQILSPLEKYDLYMKNVHGSVSRAAEYEKNKIYDEGAGPSDGRCDAWAYASLLSPEPREAVDKGGVHFTVGDLKALLTETYTGVHYEKHFGQKNDGGPDAVFADLFPEQLHTFLMVEFFGNHHPFIMDHDPSIAVWNTPVWHVHTTVLRDGRDRGVMHVKTTLWIASPKVTDYSFVGTLSYGRDYTYDLIGPPMGNGIHLDHGVWTHNKPTPDNPAPPNSIEDHPDFVVPMPPQPEDHFERKSSNPEINVRMVDEILGS